MSQVKGLLTNFASAKQINLLLFPLKTSQNDFNHLNSFKIQFKLNADKATSEAVAQRCSVKKMFLEISQNPQETTVPESLF